MLIGCPECSVQISSDASACPHCGYPLQPPAQGADQLQPPASPPQNTPLVAAVSSRGPVGGPNIPYRPETFSTLYLWCAIFYGLATTLSLLVHPSGDDTPTFAEIVSLGPGIAGLVLCCVFLYKAWNQIQDGHQRTSAGKAVGFCFIPFFNLYWYFVAAYGLAQDLNAYVRRSRVATAPVSEQLALASCILFVCGWLVVWVNPFVRVLWTLPAAVIDLILWYQIRTALMAVAHAKLQPATANIEA